MAWLLIFLAVKPLNFGKIPFFCQSLLHQGPDSRCGQGTAATQDWFWLWLVCIYSHFPSLCLEHFPSSWLGRHTWLEIVTAGEKATAFLGLTSGYWAPTISFAPPCLQVTMSHDLWACLLKTYPQTLYRLFLLQRMNVITAILNSVAFLHSSISGSNT